MDGLVLPDRRNTPKMDAVKAAYAPLKITLTDTEAVIENRNLFTDLSAYDLGGGVRNQRQAGTPCGAAGRLCTQ